MSQSVRTLVDATHTDILPSTAVVEALAEARGVDAVDLDVSLFEYVDPGALDLLFDDFGQRTRRGGRVSFLADGHRVTVDLGTDRTVEVRVEAAARAGTTDGPRAE
jgi:hypothetical protein